MLSPSEHRAVQLARDFTGDPFPFPNASLLQLIAKLADQLDEATKEIDQVYSDRSALVLLAAKLANANHIRAGLGLDPHEPDWPVLFIDLPTGQVSWHMPKLSTEYPESYGRAYAKASRMPYYTGWDGHSVDEKIIRVLDYVGQP